MDLARLIDIELQLMRDEESAREGKAAALRERDRLIGGDLARELQVPPPEGARRAASDRDFRDAVTTRWIDRIRARDASLPGTGAERGYRVAGFLLSVFGGLLGLGTARVVLAYDGREPVNVFHFIAVFFVLQVVLLLVMILTLGFHVAFGAGEVLGWMQRLVKRLARTRLVEKLLGTGRGALAPLGQLRGRHLLYAEVERWMLFALTQRFGLWFNVCALGTCLALIGFTDLAFGWSTTLDVGPGAMERFVHVLAAPWSWFFEDGVPSDRVIEASRWIRMGGHFEHGGSLAGAIQGHFEREWWRFLIAGLVAWGLLPRFGAWLFGVWKSKRSLGAVELDHAAFNRLYERLFPAPASWEGPAPEVVGKAPEARSKAEPVPAAAAVAAEPARARSRPRAEKAEAEPAAGVAIAWGRLAARRDALAGLAGKRWGMAVPAACDAGGADLARDRAAIAEVRKRRPARVALFVELGVQPTKEILGFVKELREAAGPKAALAVAIVQDAPGGGFQDADGAERAAWQQRLDASGDLYLALERVAAGS